MLSEFDEYTLMQAFISKYLDTPFGDFIPRIDMYNDGARLRGNISYITEVDSNILLYSNINMQHYKDPALQQYNGVHQGVFKVIRTSTLGGVEFKTYLRLSYLNMPGIHDISGYSIGVQASMPVLNTHIGFSFGMNDSSVLLATQVVNSSFMRYNLKLASF